MKSKVKKCNVRGCGKKARGNGMCDTHRRREWVKKNPIRDKFNKLRGSAKKKNTPFLLTLEEFTKFCEDTDYVNKCGRKKGCLHVDRKKRHLGYSYENIQALLSEVNIFKYHYLERKISSIDPELVKKKQDEDDEEIYLPHEISEFKKQFNDPLPF